MGRREGLPEHGADGEEEEGAVAQHDEEDVHGVDGAARLHQRDGHGEQTPAHITGGGRLCKKRPLMLRPH